ncbi:hypothetical protein Tco_1465175, partial [Tanacetum coccineum]
TMDGMDKEGLVEIGTVFETEASSAGEDSGLEVGTSSVFGRLSMI